MCRPLPSAFFCPRFLFLFFFGRLVKIPELQENMFQLATEMERAGLVEEVVADGLALTDVRSTSKASLSFVVHVSLFYLVPYSVLLSEQRLDRFNVKTTTLKVL